jgi:plastocyanin
MRFRAGLAFLVTVGACGGSSTPAGPGPPLPTNPFRFTITTAGVSPKELTVSPGTRVLFINNDSRRRNMTSDPHPEHNECLEINDVGLLNVGQFRETGNLVTVRTCGFHDHDDPDNNNVRGRIIIRP